MDAVPGPSRRGSKMQSKLQQVTKMASVVLSGISRAEFVRTFLHAHGLGDDFAPGPHSGPSFRMWWTGIACVSHVLLNVLYANYYSSKGTAGTIETDIDFAVAVKAILGKRTCKSVNVEFNLDGLDGFRVRSKRVSLRYCVFINATLIMFTKPFGVDVDDVLDGNEELLVGTKVRLRIWDTIYTKLIGI